MSGRRATGGLVCAGLFGGGGEGCVPLTMACSTWPGLVVFIFLQCKFSPALVLVGLKLPAPGSTQAISMCPCASLGPGFAVVSASQKAFRVPECPAAAASKRHRVSFACMSFASCQHGVRTPAHYPPT